MKTRISIFSTILVLLTILFLPLTRTQAVIKFKDATDDVKHISNFTTLGTGDYHNEIDIVGIEIHGEYLLMELQEAPLNDLDHGYYLYINWNLEIINGTYIGNYSHFEYGYRHLNKVETNLYDEHNDVIVSTIVSDSITREGKTLKVPIAEYELINSIYSPNNLTGWAIAEISTTEKFHDYIDGSPSLHLFPGFTLFTPIIPIIFLSITFLVIQRNKRNRF